MTKGWTAMKKTDKPIIIVGAGMAGLLACKAVEDMTGAPCTVLSDRVPRPLAYTFYMMPAGLTRQNSW
jgi:threonine dehydrogenase-like Zn-dependent dehydrogenase